MLVSIVRSVGLAVPQHSRNGQILATHPNATMSLFARTQHIVPPHSSRPQRPQPIPRRCRCSPKTLPCPRRLAVRSLSLMRPNTRQLKYHAHCHTLPTLCRRQTPILQTQAMPVAGREGPKMLCRSRHRYLIGSGRRRGSDPTIELAVVSACDVGEKRKCVSR